MVAITLTDEQLKLLAAAAGRVQVRDSNGNVLGFIMPIWSEEDIAEAKRRARSPGLWFTGEQVQARLRALEEEWQRTGGFDEAHMREFLRRLDEKDPGHMRPGGDAA
jgi:hypothetical protein